MNEGCRPGPATGPGPLVVVPVDLTDRNDYQWSRMSGSTRSQGVIVQAPS